MIAKPTSKIRRSTDSDLHDIFSWLTDQRIRGVEGTFLCNWKLTKGAHEKKELLVYVDGDRNEAVAYQWGGLIRPGILEVREDMRGRGIGKKLVSRRIDQAKRHNQNILLIQCKPSSSISFWERMGFTIIQHSDDGDNYAYCMLQKNNRLPPHGKPVKVVIRVYPENKKWDHSSLPHTVATPYALRTDDGVTHLGERVLITSLLDSESIDAVVEIEIEDEIRYCDKARYQSASDIGIHHCTNGYYIDNITT
jgi:GNAT superfamily N-acetyltransferase